MKLSGIGLAACAADKVFPDITRVLVSRMAVCEGNHVVWLSLAHPPPPSPSLCGAWLSSEVKLQLERIKIMNARRKGNGSFFLAFQFSLCQMTLEELEPVNALSKEQGFF